MRTGSQLPARAWHTVCVQARASTPLEGPGERQSLARRLELKPTGGSNSVSRARDLGRRTTAAEDSGLSPPLGKNSRKCAARVCRSGRGGSGGAGAGPGAGRGGARPRKGERGGPRSLRAPGEADRLTDPAVDHRSSAEGAVPGRTLGTMTQTPAFDKPKVSAGGGSGSGVCSLSGWRA